MPQYKDIDEILKNLPDDLPYKASVKRVLIQAPTADVVPKSEVEELKEWVEAYKNTIASMEKIDEELRAELENIKSEVVRKIFEEIDQAIAEQYPIYTVKSIIKSLDYVKKKYTGGE